ncbi:DUF1648 domain-containing protein [Kitasatospora sp. NPDC097643]|uniref:DUF1648 domain-containing protein n=1 Tax=Kitasatospora sp. NPDC097643 TaxID=3157230 RepID=UPI00331C3364
MNNDGTDDGTDDGTHPGTEGAHHAARRGALWAAAVWSAGVLVLLPALPWAARHRLPDPVATHWGGREPDGSMSLTAATLLPAVLWLVVVAAAVIVHRFGGVPARGGAGALLAGGSVLLTGVQASIVHANLDRARWQDASSMDAWVLLLVAATGIAALLAWLAARPRGGATRSGGPGSGSRSGAGSGPDTADGREPVLELPDGERAVWLSRAAKPWMQLMAAVLGVGTVAGVLGGASGLIGFNWSLIGPLVATAAPLLFCSSVQARVTARGLDVGFGPFGWPARHWSLAEISSARAERRTPAQAGGWGYRINSLGTTVMLRSGDCLVVRDRKGAEFAVSVDDAERGAALLNALAARSGHPAV